MHSAARIRIALLFFGSMLLASPASIAQDSTAPYKRLSLTASIDKQEYCLIPDGRTNLRIYLRLEFTNVSHEKLIVSQKSNVVDGIDITDYAAGSKPFSWPHISIDRTIPKDEVIVPQSPGENYSVLKPGKTLRTNSQVHVDLLHSKLPGDGLVNPGKYSLAVTVATWLDSDAVAEASRQAWRHSGYLVSEDVTSSPVDFTVSANPQFHDCGYRE